jgi:hypothetical protein
VRAAEQLERGRELALAPDEGRQLRREIVRRAVQRAQRGKVAAQARMRHLVDALRRRQAAQLYRSQIPQRDAGRQAIANERGDRLRDQHLTAVRDAHEPRGAVDLRTEEIAVAALVDAGVDSASHGQRQIALASALLERLLQIRCGADRVQGIHEVRVNAIARGLHDGAAIACDDVTRQRIVTRERRAHALGVLLPEARASLDVGEQERDDAGCCGHGDSGRRPAAARWSAGQPQARSIGSIQRS